MLLRLRLMERFGLLTTGWLGLFGVVFDEGFVVFGFAIGSDGFLYGGVIAL